MQLFTSLINRCNLEVLDDSVCALKYLPEVYLPDDPSLLTQAFPFTSKDSPPGEPLCLSNLYWMHIIMQM